MYLITDKLCYADQLVFVAEVARFIYCLTSQTWKELWEMFGIFSLEFLMNYIFNYAVIWFNCVQETVCTLMYI